MVLMLIIPLFLQVDHVFDTANGVNRIPDPAPAETRAHGPDAGTPLAVQECFPGKVHATLLLHSNSGPAQRGKLPNTEIEIM